MYIFSFSSPFLPSFKPFFLSTNLSSFRPPFLPFFLSTKASIFVFLFLSSFLPYFLSTNVCFFLFPLPFFLLSTLPSYRSFSSSFLQCFSFPLTNSPTLFIPPFLPLFHHLSFPFRVSLCLSPCVSFIAFLPPFFPPSPPLLQVNTGSHSTNRG